MATFDSAPDVLYLDEPRWASIHAERASDPQIDRFWDLVREYAERQGGAELEYWKHSYGHLWGIRYISRSHAAARAAGVDMDQVAQFGVNMASYVNTRLDAEFGPDRVSRSVEPPPPIDISQIPSSPNG